MKTSFDVQELENKIDFAIAFAVNNANPNGDPLNGNRPRTTSEGLGEVSDVALKRKIRNRLQDAGESVFVQSDDRSDDGAKSLSDRFNTYLKTLPKDEQKQKNKEGDFEDNKALSPMFLLGYSCQRRASKRKAQEISQKNNSNN